MAWRVADSLIKLRDQVNERWPTRSKSHDGTIGDAAHASRSSDHNPWVQDAGQGVVTALDITHDPGDGVDTHALAEWLRNTRDSRVKYVISNRRIFSSQTNPWVWRPYSGSNPHIAHMHVSVLPQKAKYDSTAHWALPGAEWHATLRRGDRGPSVRLMQQRIGIANDGVFGRGTEDAVRDFQAKHGLASDGVVGPDTWVAILKGPAPSVLTTAPAGDVAEPEPPDADAPSARPVLRKGAQGDEVKIVQRLLMVTMDGKFGDTTQSAVKAFQRGVGITTDGVVGSLTWEKLDALEQEPSLPWQKWQTAIVATVFGGKKDPNKSAYENRWISDTEIGVSLPFRFGKDRPQVVVANPANGKTITAEIVDVGPWNTDDPYWDVPGQRPQAEEGRDRRGRKTNRAGIDLTPGAARALGIQGKGTVNWMFATDVDVGGASA
jgi:peptidoglycan hydrolase-like protein with peptidoglycan-binding domain